MSAEPEDLDDLWVGFHRLINMTSRELRDWLHSEPAQGVRQLLPGDVSAQETGRRTLEILSKRKQDLTDEDVHHMRRVIDFVTSRVGESPEPASSGQWRQELMTVGHDPLRSP